MIFYVIFRGDEVMKNVLETVCRQRGSQVRGDRRESPGGRGRGRFIRTYEREQSGCGQRTASEHIFGVLTVIVSH